MSEPAEGWYADPTGAAQLRWWDGRAWTEYVEPYEAAPPQAGAAPAQAEAIPAYDEAPHYAQPEHVISTAAAEASAEIPPIPSPDDPAHWEASDPIPSPEETGTWEPATASSMNEGDDAPIPMPGEAASPRGTQERSGTLKWTLGCAASWVLVAVFIAVLVVAWSHLGTSSRIHDDAKSRAETAQQELDTAQSTLADINRQIEEAQK